MSFISELKRRNVFRVAIAYVLIGWLVLQVGDTLAPALRLPEWVNTALAFFLILGFPLALLFAWAYELTPDGLKKEKDVDRAESITPATGRKIDFVIIGILTLALAYFAWDKFLRTADDAAGPEQEGESIAARQSIAVLPFINMSDDPGNEYFSDGISEEILNLLARIDKLQVTSRSSAFSFKGQNADIPAIAAKLNVAHVLEGSVRKAGDRVRITAQLIEAAGDTHLWSETYDRQLKDVFGVQAEIATAVVDALKIELLGEQPRAAETDPEAYRLFLEGLYFFHQGSAEGSERAEQLFRQALAIDPGFASAWAELAFVYGRGAGLGLRPIAEGNELARDAAKRALAIDPGHAGAYATLSWIATLYDWDFAAADEYRQRALAADPDNAAVLRSAGVLATKLGRFDEAIELFSRAVAVDPVSGIVIYRLGRTYYYAGHHDEALPLLRKSLTLSPGLIAANYFVGRTLLAQGKLQEALAAVQRERNEVYRLTGTAVVQHALGNAAASDAALAQLEAGWADEASYQAAQVYAYRGQNDMAFTWLERAYENRDSGVTNMLVDPLVKNLHADPRWKPFITRLGLPN